jgi:hypothetical protein
MTKWADSRSNNTFHQGFGSVLLNFRGMGFLYEDRLNNPLINIILADYLQDMADLGHPAYIQLGFFMFTYSQRL